MINQAELVRMEKLESRTNYIQMLQEKLAYGHKVHDY